MVAIVSRDINSTHSWLPQQLHSYLMVSLVRGPLISKERAYGLTRGAGSTSTSAQATERPLSLTKSQLQLQRTRPNQTWEFHFNDVHVHLVILLSDPSFGQDPARSPLCLFLKTCRDSRLLPSIHTLQRKKLEHRSTHAQSAR